MVADEAGAAGDAAGPALDGGAESGGEIGRQGGHGPGSLGDAGRGRWGAF